MAVKKKKTTTGKNIFSFWRRKEKQYRILKFLIKFNVFALPLYALLVTDWQSGWLQSFTADTTYSLLQATGIAAERTGNFIAIQLQNGTWGAFINWDCTGWKSFLALFALVMATDFPLKKKAKGLAILLPALFLVNIIRIVFMFHFARGFDLAYFETAHAVVWSWGLIAAILVFWVLWMRHAAKLNIPEEAKYLHGSRRA